MKKKFEVTRILPYKHTLVFEQIVNFERYEQYLPFCSASRSLSSDNKNFSQIGELEFEIAGVSYKIKSGNVIEDKRILITQINGPFEEISRFPTEKLEHIPISMHLKMQVFVNCQNYRSQLEYFWKQH